MKTQSDLVSFAGSRWALGLGLVASGGFALSQLAIPITLGGIVDFALVRGDLEALRRWVVFLVAAALLALFFKVLHQLIFGRARERALSRLQTRILRSVLSQPTSRVENERLGEVQSIFSSSLPKIASYSYQILGEGSLLLFQLIGLVGFLIAKYGILGVWVLAAVPVYLLVPALLARKTRYAQTELLEANHKTQSLIHEALQGHRELRAFSQEDWPLQGLREPLKHRMIKQTRMLLLHALQWTTITLSFLVGAVVYWFGGKLVLAGSMTIGDLVALVTIVGFLDGPLAGLGNLFSQYQSIVATSDMLKPWLEVTSREVGLFGSLQFVRGDNPPEITVENLSFRYSDSGPLILKNISFQVRAGSTVAVVGRSGAGKSTLMDVLLGFYSPTSGNVLVDGIDFHKFDSRTIKRYVGKVSQDPFLFPVSVLENIRLGRDEFSDKEVRRAAEVACAHNFISVLPDGYDTVLGDRGVGLSGGQRQRIAIARAVLGNPLILVLDEAMSNLDPQSDRQVRRALAEAKRGRTTLVVTHDQAGAQSADRIFSLDAGMLMPVDRATGAASFSKTTDAVLPIYEAS